MSEHMGHDELTILFKSISLGILKRVFIERERERSRERLPIVAK